MNESIDPEYDIVIIGARVAGASLALLLGERGHRVLMVDRDRFPSDTLSTHFMAPSAVSLLGTFGVLPDVEAQGFRRMTRTRTYIGDCHFEGPAAPDGGYGLAPRRDSLDAIFIAHAIARGGVTFRERTLAVGLIAEGGRVVGARLRDAAGQEHAVRAQVVVGADGKYSQVAEWVDAPRYDEVPPLRPAYYGYYHDLTPLPEPALELFLNPGQIGAIFPMQPGVDCLVLEVQPKDFAAFRADPQGTFERRFRALPGMAARLAHATLEGKLQGTPGIANYFRQPYGPGWALTGDAGYLKDPSTAFGIGDALSQARMLAKALNAVRAGADWEETMAAFQQERDEAMRPLYQVTLGFTQMRDAGPEDLAWMSAVLSTPLFVHTLSTRFAAVMPQALGPTMLPWVEMQAEGFTRVPVVAGSDD